MWSLIPVKMDLANAANAYARKQTQKPRREPIITKNIPCRILEMTRAKSLACVGE